MFCYELMSNYIIIVIIIIFFIIINFRILQFSYQIGYSYITNFDKLPYSFQEITVAMSSTISSVICFIFISLFVSLSSLCLSYSGKITLLILLFIEIAIMLSLSCFVSTMIVNYNEI